MEAKREIEKWLLEHIIPLDDPMTMLPSSVYSKTIVHTDRHTKTQIGFEFHQFTTTCDSRIFLPHNNNYYKNTIKSQQNESIGPRIGPTLNSQQQ